MLPSRAVEVKTEASKSPVSNESRFQNLQRPATTVKDWLAQNSTPIEITGVRLNQTASGLEVLLETTSKQPLSIVISGYGTTYVANIVNARLALPEGSFRQENPIAGITVVSVTQQGANGIRMSAIGSEGIPVAKVRQSNGNTVFSLTTPTVPTAQTPTPFSPPEGETVPLPTPTQPGESTPEVQEEIPAPQAPAPDGTAQGDEEMEIVVTGEQDGYSVPNATTATKTDTPLRDIPQSIQVVPQQVIEDRNVRSVTEALETVSGVATGARPYGGAPITFRIIRGFDQAGSGVVNFRNGFPDGDFYVLSPIGTVERVEVLKGPASVLFGAGEPGGIVNTVTKKPLSEPYYKLAFEAGNYGLYQPSIDFSGPLNADQTLLYRFIASYQGSSDFQDISNTKLTAIAPSITWKLGEQTNLEFYYEFTNLAADPAAGLSTAVLLSDGSLTPRDFVTFYPELQSIDVTTHRFGYTLEHEFNDNLQLRNNIAINLTRFGEDVGTGFTLVEDRFLDPVQASTFVYERNNYFGQIDLLGTFQTGAISHQVLTGFDFNRNSNVGNGFEAGTPVPPIDIRNPSYDIPTPEYSRRGTFSDSDFVRRSYGVYLQDQIALGENLKLLVGGRYDWVSTDFEGDFNTPGEVITLPTRNDDAFSPRIGLVYQPSENVSLYASYTRSFFSVYGYDNQSSDEDVIFDPTRGTQYEVGVKTDFLARRLSATLAAYHLTKTNVLTPNPDDPDFSIQTGEQRSQGIELDITGEILPGWNVTAAYAYTDAEVTEDNTFPVGNRLPNVPENQASLWTTYEIQAGDLEGLGFGLGLFYVGARQGDLDNSFEMGDYFRTDAALYYRRGRFNAAINMRNLFDIDAAAFAYSRAYIQRTEPFTIVGSISWEF
ncbi:ferrichrome-iron receptor [Chroococcidiopsis cubana SAG 39.79]|uniref:Ferrichrome-iron receptor n=3 Tax=Chroococcidiopsis TaxID=54298 RepID=A0AB37ULQ1_9CYAN|nr:TonB-dependent siderophore receptor [Chroococcidiopsis cubana]RUT12290.1 ferrichrome-iron receptor [Chroococcidiopsis cubana SAG 39.79]